MKKYKSIESDPIDTNKSSLTPSIHLMKAITFCFLYIFFLTEQSYAKTRYEPSLQGMPSVANSNWDLTADAFALTIDGKKLYLLKEQKLFVFQLVPFKKLKVIDVPFKRKVKERRSEFRIWVTSDEHFLNLVRSDEVIQYDLQAKEVIQTLRLENQKFFRSAFYNNELLLFCFDRTSTHANLGSGYSGPNPHTIKVFDAHTLKFKKNLNYLLGIKYINSVADTITQLDDKIFWFQPYGFGKYGQNTAWLRVIDSNTFLEELVVFTNDNSPFLSIDDFSLMLRYVTELQDYSAKEHRQIFLPKKTIVFDLKTRQFSEVSENFNWKRSYVSAFEKGYLRLHIPSYYQKNKETTVALGNGLNLYSASTKKLLKLFLDSKGESILIDPDTGAFIATLGARKYLYFKYADDQYSPINDEQYQQFSKTQSIGSDSIDFRF